LNFLDGKTASSDSNLTHLGEIRTKMHNSFTSLD